MAKEPTTEAPWYGSVQALRERVRQWRELNRWEDREDPLRVRPAEEALRWSGMLLEARRRNGDRPPEDDGSGLVRMRECLAKLTPPA